MKDILMKTRYSLLFVLAFAGIASSTCLAAEGDNAAGAPAAPGARGARGAGARGGGGGMGLGNTALGKIPTLAAPTTPTKAPAADGGFIQRWLILEPISTSGGLADSAVKTTVNTEYFPNQLTVIPKDGDKVTVNGTELKWHAVDTLDFNVDLLHFARNYNMRYENCVFWAVTIIDCPQDIPEARLAIGSNGASVWWVNGKEACQLVQNRQSAVDDGISKRLSLKKGQNVIRAAVLNSSGATDFNARILGADEKPLTSFTITLTEK